MPDSNIVFPAVRIAESDFLAIWNLPGVTVLLSQYSIGEVSRPLARAEQRSRLWQLVYRSELVSDGDAVLLSQHVVLPQKDQPILRSAIAGDADTLVTGDQTHFGALFGMSVGGVLIEHTRVFKDRYPMHFPIRKGA